ncbi:MAG: DMT family transporter [Acuticoccus sp.]
MSTTSSPARPVPAPAVETRPDRPLAAAALIFFASAVVAGTTVLAKALGTDALGEPVHPLQVAQGRFIFALLTLCVILPFVRPQLTRPNLPLHCVRVTCGFTTVVLLFAAATMIPLSDATAISFLSPIVTMVLAAPFLGERVGVYRWVAAGIAMTGAVVLFRPGADAVAFGAVLALGSALAMGLELTLIKRLTRREGPWQILIMSNLLGTIISTVAVLAVWQMPTGAQWKAMMALGSLMLLAQFCYVQAMRLADASFVAPVAYTTLVFAALYDIIIFAEWPDTASVIGASLILVGALVLTTRARR